VIIFIALFHIHDYFDYTEVLLSISVTPQDEYMSCSFGNHLLGYMHLSASIDCSFSFTAAVVAACQQAIRCLVTICSTYVALVCHNGSYYLFDSYSRNLRDLPVDDGSAVLLEFTSVDSLHSHMKRPTHHLTMRMHVILSVCRVTMDAVSLTVCL